MFSVFFTIIIILFVTIIGIIGLSRGNYDIKVIGHIDDPDNAKDRGTIILFGNGSGYSHLMGILGGGFYLHNISLPIYRNTKKIDKAPRDMFLGFFVVFMSYVVCGVIGCFGFSSKEIHFSTDKMQDNCIN